MANPYVCACDRSSAECSACHCQDVWREGFVAGVAMAKEEAQSGAGDWGAYIDWSYVNYALDKIKEEA